MNEDPLEGFESIATWIDGLVSPGRIPAFRPRFYSKLLGVAAKEVFELCAAGSVRTPKLRLVELLKKEGSIQWRTDHWETSNPAFWFRLGLKVIMVDGVSFPVITEGEFLRFCLCLEVDRNAHVAKDARAYKPADAGIAEARAAFAARKGGTLSPKKTAEAALFSHRESLFWAYETLDSGMSHRTPLPQVEAKIGDLRFARLVFDAHCRYETWQKVKTGEDLEPSELEHALELMRKPLAWGELTFLYAHSASLVLAREYEASKAALRAELEARKRAKADARRALRPPRGLPAVVPERPDTPTPSVVTPAEVVGDGHEGEPWPPVLSKPAPLALPDRGRARARALSPPRDGIGGGGPRKWGDSPHLTGAEYRALLLARSRVGGAAVPSLRSPVGSLSASSASRPDSKPPAGGEAALEEWMRRHSAAPGSRVTSPERGLKGGQGIEPEPSAAAARKTAERMAHVERLLGAVQGWTGGDRLEILERVARVSGASLANPIDPGELEAETDAGAAIRWFG